jgi:Uncharacterized protein conserved in bacteria
MSASEINQDSPEQASDTTIQSGQRSARKAVLVVGMHRSGTSALSGLLGNLGCDLPATLMEKTERNPKGYFESKKIHDFHEEIFSQAGTSWDDFRPFPEAWLESSKSAEYVARAQELVQSEFGSSRLFVLKDPRICRLMPFWLEVLENLYITPLVVHIIRNPLEVAQSLRDRDQIDTSYGALLWLNHILEAERGSRALTRSFTSFEKLLSNWGGETKRLEQELGLSWSRFSTDNVQDLESFIDPNLKHYSTNSAGVIDNDLTLSPVWETYAIMQRWVENGPNINDMEKLDSIRQNLLEGTAILGSVVQSRSLAIQAHRESLRKKLTDATAELTEKSSDFERAVQERDAALSHAEALITELEQTHQTAKSIACSHSEADRKLAEITARLTEQDANMDALKQEYKASEARINELTSALVQRNAEIADLRAECDAAIQKKNQETSKMEGRLLEVTLEITQSRAETERRDQELARAGKLLLSYTSKLDAAQHEMNTLREESARREQQLRQTCEKRDQDLQAVIKTSQITHNHNQELLNSTSWRITAPLRWLSTKVKCRRRKVNNSCVLK